MPDLNITLLTDLPEEGPFWKKGNDVYGMDETIANKYITEGKAVLLDKKEPIWEKAENKKDSDNQSSEEE